MSEGQAVETPLEEGQELVDAPEQEVADPFAALKELGFTDAEVAAKSYKEAQKKLTQLAQENAALKKSQQYRPPREQVTDDDYFERPVQTTERVADQIIDSRLNRFKWELAINSEKAKDPKMFEKLSPFLTRVAEQNPHLDSDPSYLPMMVEKAKELRLQDLKERAEELREAGLIGGLTETVNDSARIANMAVKSTKATIAKQVTPIDPGDVDAVTADIFRSLSGKK